MPTRSDNIFKAARELLAVLAPHSGNSSLSQRMRPVQQSRLRRPSEYGAVATSQQPPVRIGKPASLSDRAEHDDTAAAAEQHADASFDPRADEHWSP